MLAVAFQLSQIRCFLAVFAAVLAMRAVVRYEAFARLVRAFRGFSHRCSPVSAVSSAVRDECARRWNRPSVSVCTRAPFASIAPIDAFIDARSMMLPSWPALPLQRLGTAGRWHRLTSLSQEQQARCGTTHEKGREDKERFGYPVASDGRRHTCAVWDSPPVAFGPIIVAESRRHRRTR